MTRYLTDTEKMLWLLGYLNEEAPEAMSYALLTLDGFIHSRIPHDNDPSMDIADFHRYTRRTPNTEQRTNTMPTNNTPISHLPSVIHITNQTELAGSITLGKPNDVTSASLMIGGPEETNDAAMLVFDHAHQIQQTIEHLQGMLNIWNQRPM